VAYVEMALALFCDQCGALCGLYSLPGSVHSGWFT
jgi:hypothetical protein